MFTTNSDPWTFRYIIHESNRCHLQSEVCLIFIFRKKNQIEIFPCLPPSLKSRKLEILPFFPLFNDHEKRIGYPLRSPTKQVIWYMVGCKRCLSVCHSMFLRFEKCGWSPNETKQVFHIFFYNCIFMITIAYLFTLSFSFLISF